MASNQAVVNIKIITSVAVKNIKGLSAEVTKLKSNILSLNKIRLLPTFNAASFRKSFTSATQSVNAFRVAFTSAFRSINAQVTRLQGRLKGVNFKINLDVTAALGQLTQLLALLKQIEPLLNKLSKAQFTANLQRQLANTRKNVNDLSTGVFRFRDAVNSVANSVAVLFRRLARLRTAFFILITFLAVRPAFRFFRNIIDESGAGIRAVRELTERFQRFKQELSVRLAPVFVNIFQRFINFISDSIEKIADLERKTRGISATLFGLVQALKIVGKTGFAVFQTIINVVNGLHINIKILILAVKELAEGFAELFTTDIVQSAKDIGNGFKEAFLSKDPSKIGETFGQKVFDGARKAIRNLTLRKFFFEPLVKRALGDPAAQEQLRLKNEYAQIVKDLEKSGESVARIFGSLQQDFNDLLTDPTNLKEAISQVIFAFEEASTVLTRAGGNTGRDYALAFGRGLERNIKTVLDSVADLAEALRTSLEDSLSSLLQSIGDKTVKLKDIIVDTLRTIQKAFADFFAKQAVAGLIGSLTGTTVGNLLGLGGAGGAAQYDVPYYIAKPTAEGGVFHSRQIRSIAEAGPEAVIPLKRGAVPVQLEGGSGGTYMIVNNISAIDQAGVASFLSKSEAPLKNMLIKAAAGGDANFRRAFKLS